MSDITRQTLAFSIFALAFDRARLIDRLSTVSDEVEEDEHLSDTLMQMDKALAELEELYEQYGTGDRDNFDALKANGEDDYQRFCAEQRAQSAA